MEQSVVTADTLGILVAKAEKVVDRKLTIMEYAMMDFALEQIRLGLVEVN